MALALAGARGQGGNTSNSLHPCTLPQRAPFTAVSRVSPLCAAFCPDSECVCGATGKANVAPTCAKNTKSQSRCWIVILYFLRTSAQRGLFLPRRTHTRCRGRKPHTAATRASRHGAGARHTRRVDRADCFHGQKIGTIGTFKGNPPFAVAAVRLC